MSSGVNTILRVNINANSRERGRHQYLVQSKNFESQAAARTKPHSLATSGDNATDCPLSNARSSASAEYIIRRTMGIVKTL